MFAHQSLSICMLIIIEAMMGVGFLGSAIPLSYVIIECVSVEMMVLPAQIYQDTQAKVVRHLLLIMFFLFAMSY